MLTVLTISTWKFANEEMRHDPITLQTRVARSCRYGRCTQLSMIAIPE